MLDHIHGLDNKIQTMEDEMVKLGACTGLSADLTDLESCEIVSSAEGLEKLKD
jgi:hypothetical protein